LARKIQDVFDQAEIQIVIENEVMLNDTPFSDVTNLVTPKQRPSGAPTDPEETPDGDRRSSRSWVISVCLRRVP